jgi:hypothetical protein
MEMRPSRDEGGETLVVVRCNDGSIWVDTGNDRLPWRRLAAIPEPTDEEMEPAKKARQAAIDAAMEEGRRRDRENAKVELAQALELQRREMEATERAISRYLFPWRRT